jgi:hypothetical protein
MIGDTETFRLDSEDDNLHAPTDSHPWWTETFWLSFGIPDRHMHVSIYPWFRKNIGMQAGGVLIWDPSSDLPWDLAFCQYDYHLPLDPDLDLRKAKLSNGLSLRCLESQQAYHVRYEHDDLKIDVTFRGLMPPQVSGRDGRANHLDQPGHVVGEVVLRGERIEVNSPGMRDRSWSVRLGATRVGYAWGSTADGDSFLSLSLPSGDKEPVCDGYLLREGKPARVVEGTRVTSRSEGRPSTIHIEATDALRRKFVADGTSVSRMGFCAYPGTFAWDSMIEWNVDGSVAWGEDQDVWTMAEWRDRPQ